MAETNTKTILSVCATTSSRLPDLVIKNGQLIFIQDKHRIAFDFGGSRKFYNQIEELDTDNERIALDSPVSGSYYFVISTAVLWTYQDGWVQITTPPDEIVFIGTELPELGSGNNVNEKTLYVNKKEKEISVYDSETNSYVVVANKSDSVDTADIDLLFA